MAILGVLLPVLLLASVARANPITPDNTQALVSGPQEMDYRLPSNSIPLEYKITMSPNLTDFTFEGESVIDIQVLVKSRNLTLHARGLDIDPKSIELIKDGKPDPIKVPLADNKFMLIPEKEFLIIETQSDLPLGKYQLRLSFAGKLTDNLRGFYRSKYINEKNEKRWLAVTHFEPTSARLAFPCYDEPALKAVFQIIINHQEEYNAVSNTPIDTSIGHPTVNKVKRTTFKKTPKMSTYLIAFAVSDYVRKGDVKFGVLTKPPSADDTEYALKYGKKELKALGEMIGIDYYNDMKMEKMDQISVPDFAAGAMENWGLITYRESALLFNQKTSTAASKQSIATVIAHELAHQWFGNLVTPAWWKYIWLNEGFATYFQYAGGDMVEDEWRLMEQFVVTALQQTAFGMDGSEKARPINSEAESPQEIASLFDGIVYQKAGSIIRMMENILTKEVFYDGLLKYLNKHKSGVATSDDLFASLQVAVNEAANRGKEDETYKKDKKDKDEKKDEVLKVAKVMGNWITKAGYPIVNVKRDKKKVIITQEQFPIPESKEDNKWYVPINYAIGNDEQIDFEDTAPVAFLEPTEEAELEVEVAENTWIIVNKQQTGYYRVNYDSKNWELITKKLKGDNFTDIHQLNRAQLIDDALNLARIGKLDYTIAFELLSYLQQETDYISWVPAFRGFEHLNKMLSNSKQYPKFKIFVHNQLKAVVKELKFAPNETDSHIDTLSRVQVLKWACAVGHKDCIKHVNTKLDAYLKDAAKAELDVNLKSHILCAAVREAKDDKWNKVFEAYKKNKDQSEKRVLLTALGCSDSPKILKNFAEKIFNESLGVEDPDTAFSGILSGSVHGVDIGLEALENNIEVIREMENGDAKLKKYIDELGSRINTLEQQTKLGLLVAMEGISKETSAAAIQNTFKNLYWVQSYEEKVEKWLNEHVKETNGKENAANSVSIAAFLIVLPILITRFY